MRIGPFTLQRTKAVPAALSSVDRRGGWWPVIREPFTGAWQRNVSVTPQDVLTYGTAWACITLIASDIGKLWLMLVEKDSNGIWSETENSAYSPVLRKPNHFQTRVKFFEYWIISKLVTGNTYVLKERDARGVVVGLYVLDPTRVTVLVAPDGSVFYELATDYLSGVKDSVTVPAREIIHDICVPLYHPLVGVSPIHACGLAALQGLKIQQQSAKLFSNGSQPGGMLTAPNEISDATAKRLSDHWEANYGGEDNIGKIVVLGNGLKFEPMAMTAVDAQLIDQLKWGSENICSVFHVPGFLVGVGPPPPYTDIQSMNMQYYSQALQNMIENCEILLTEGLELQSKYAVEFDLKALLRMDSATQTTVMAARIAAGFMAPNEARGELNMKPVEGGDSCFLQQQNYSLSALHRRDEKAAAPSSKPIEAVQDRQAQTQANDKSRRFASVVFRKATTAGLFSENTHEA